jgi:hypothetical protein
VVPQIPLPVHICTMQWARARREQKGQTPLSKCYASQIHHHVLAEVHVHTLFSMDVLERGHRWAGDKSGQVDG